MDQPSVDQEDVSTKFALNEIGSVLRDFLRPYLLEHVRRSSETTVVQFQKFCGVVPPTNDKKSDDKSDKEEIRESWADPKAPLGLRIWNALFAIIFKLGATFGDEIFYILAFPFLFWNVDTALGRRVIYIWVAQMYIGQWVKDYFRLPRPFRVSNRVRLLEKTYSVEYGFPSTHAMSIIGQAVGVLYFTAHENYSGKDDYPLFWACLGVAALVTATCAGRVYLGVHSIPDLIGGVILGFTILIVLFRFQDAVDVWNRTNESAAYLPLIGTVMLILTYPIPKAWTSAYGDTSMIAGVGNGVITASYFAAHHPRFPLPWIEPDGSYTPFFTWLAWALARCVMGYTVLILTRAVMKKLCFTVLPMVLPRSDVAPKNRYAVEVPTKFICYTCVGFNAVYTVPLIMAAVGL